MVNMLYKLRKAEKDLISDMPLPDMKRKVFKEIVDLVASEWRIKYEDLEKRLIVALERNAKLDKELDDIKRATAWTLERE